MHSKTDHFPGWFASWWPGLRWFLGAVALFVVSTLVYHGVWLKGFFSRQILGKMLQTAGYEISMRCRKRIEEPFGWGKCIAYLAQLKVRGSRVNG